VIEPLRNARRVGLSGKAAEELFEEAMTFSGS
jgi:hypothetical protein